MLFAGRATPRWSVLWTMIPGIVELPWPIAGLPPKSAMVCVALPL
jgi:hypothetical protein